MILQSCGELMLRYIIGKNCGYQLLTTVKPWTMYLISSFPTPEGCPRSSMGVGVIPTIVLGLSLSVLAFANVKHWPLAVAFQTAASDFLVPRSRHEHQ